METAMNEFMLDLREAIMIWLALLGTVGGAFALMSIIARRGHTRTRVSPRPLVPRQRTRTPSPAPKAASPTQELQRYADEVAVAAGRAAVMSQRRRVEWVSAQRTQDAAWRAYEAAELAARRVDLAAAFPAPDEPFAPEDLSSRKRQLRRLATDAHARGELSAEQLADALAYRNGWDPERHPIELETMLRHITRDRLMRAYQEASVIERSAWYAADMAAAAKRSLDDEAFAATLNASRAQLKVAVDRPQRRMPARLRTARLATSRA